MIIDKLIILIDKEVFIKAKFIPNYGTSNELWYSLDKKYSKYITDERTDPFLVGLLLLAMKNKEDIYIKGTISEKLYYNLKHYTIRTLSKAFSFPEIEITCENIDNTCISNTNKSATGFSGGIDSFFTLYEHLNKNCLALQRNVNLFFENFM